MGFFSLLLSIFEFSSNIFDYLLLFLEIPFFEVPWSVSFDYPFNLALQIHVFSGSVSDIYLLFILIVLCLYIYTYTLYCTYTSIESEFYFIKKVIQRFWTGQNEYILDSKTPASIYSRRDFGSYHFCTTTNRDFNGFDISCLRTWLVWRFLFTFSLNYILIYTERLN